MAISFQHSTDYNPEIRDIGCEYLCCLAAASHRTNRMISTESVNYIWECLIDEDLVDPRTGLDMMLSYYRTFDLVFDILDLPEFHGDQVGNIVNGRVTYWGWVTKQHFNYVVRRMKTKNGANHSVLLDKFFRPLYDPAPGYPGGATFGLCLFHVDDHPLHTDSKH